MQNPELCRELLQRILPNLKIDRIEYPQLQKSINVDMDAHSVRNLLFDVLVLRCAINSGFSTTYLHQCFVVISQR